MPTTAILVHYCEIATKGRNRSRFIDKLRDNIRAALCNEPLGAIKKFSGRLCLLAKKGEHFGPQTDERLTQVFGISSFSPSVRVDLNLGAIQDAGLRLVQDRDFATFRVTARRAFKELPLDSMTVNREVGGHILQSLAKTRSVRAKMKGAEAELWIEMIPEGAWLYTEKLPGPSGLPVGISGQVACLLSGGIDSPVAANRMQKRGCEVVFIHFHSHPFVSRASQEKAQDLAEVLCKYQRSGLLYMVPFGETQRAIVDSRVPASLRVVLYRRLMVRIAEAIASDHGAGALVTGEALGQVASQTLGNIAVVDDAASIIVLRPLIGYDKAEIIAEAMALGTYETSIQPDEDCCQLFMPKNPETNAKLEAVIAAEDKLDVEALCNAALASTSKLKARQGGLFAVAG